MSFIKFKPIKIVLIFVCSNILKGRRACNLYYSFASELMEVVLCICDELGDIP